MRTVLRGREFTVSAEEVKEVAGKLSPQPVRRHAIVVNGHHFPPKQLLEAVLEAKGIRMDRLAYTSKDAYYLFTRLGFAHVRLGEKTEGIEALKRLTGTIAVGGDALRDSESYYE
ncbi:MAG: hypothetical protein IBX67_06755 [Dehalococcoidia bacterium]|nr:hypothetical protein [Dehalococcoidia bacterium]